MKNILLMDYELKYTDIILEQTDWNISILITLTGNNIERLKNNKRVKKVIYDVDFIENNCYEHFDYKDIDCFYKAQLKYENYFNKKLVDYQIGKYNYYKGCSLAKKIFTENKIDCVIIANLNHGIYFDSLLVEIANNLNIPNYNIMPMIYQKLILFNNLKNDLVEINNDSINYSNSLFYKIDVDDLKIKCRDNNYFRNALRKIFYKFGGWLGIEFLGCIRHLDLGEDEWGVNFIDRLYHYLKLKFVKINLDKISYIPNKKENYIYFSLHAEPEATITDRSKMDSQLFAIKMLSVIVPDGWMIYVKEHPDQFRVNTVLFSLHLYNSVVFKNKHFYNELKKLKNVKIIKTDKNAKDIIKYSKAVATMSGSVALEGAKLNKPVMIFSAERTIYRKCKGFYKIDSYKSCQSAINKISNGEVSDYSDLDVILKKYLLNDDKKGYEKAISAIYSSLK